MSSRYTPLARLLAAGAALLVAASLPLGPAWATSPDQDEVRTDRVETTLEWGPCDAPGPSGGVECATVRLPLDYDEPDGATVEVFVAKHVATGPGERIGTLFVNPGGPGTPGSPLALAADELFTPEILARFDILGMDPRGTGSSTTVTCGSSTRKQNQDMRGLAPRIPLTAPDQAAFLTSAKKEALNCSRIGAPLLASMSSAQVARDMDVLRRLVDDDRLSYLGSSYGSYLGQVYAGMFPDRVRAIAIDGVLDPVAWAGTPGTSDEPVTLRLGSAEGAHAALQKGFELCAASPGCLSGPDPQATFDRVADRLKAGPVSLQVPGVGAVTLDYGTFIGGVLEAMYLPDGPEWVDRIVASSAQFMDPTLAPTAAYAARVETDTAVRAAVAKLPPHTLEGYHAMWQPLDAFNAVLCTDSLNTAAPKDWAPAIAARAEDAPHFAAAWGWGSAVCADRFWTAQDEDAWRGPFTHATSAPLLLVATTHDPTTPYAGAVTAAALAPNSALLTVEAFGHLAYGNQRCATAAIDAYLLDGTVPDDLTCEAEYRLFGATG